MPYLTIGDRVQAVTEGVARAWPAVHAAAMEYAAQHGGSPRVYVRTDSGGFGSMPIHPDVPVTFSEDGDVTAPDLGTIVAATADPDRLSREAAAAHGQEPEGSDEEILELVRELKADRPDLDWDNLLMGRLAGPPTPDRPDVPVWDYIAFADAHDGVRLSDLTAARFPVRHFEGSWDVTSVDEQLKPFPLSLKSTPPRPRFEETAHTVIDRYCTLHDAGVIDWDPAERGIVHVRPSGEYRAALRARLIAQIASE